MRVAVQGCAHGELDLIYRTLERWKLRDGVNVDLLLLCGDVQTMRHASDLQSLACPAKFRRMGDFHDYYTGKKKAPVLTIFIGGNHEASTYLRELYHGGWVAHNIYYMGFSGVVQVNGLRIAGLSGIFKRHHYHWGHHEVPPFDDGTCRSVYHVRYEDMWKLSLIEQPVDIFLSHDWPQGVEKYGDIQGLLKKKPYFKKEINDGTLGSQPGIELLRTLKPTRWFAAHLHVRYEAEVPHNEGISTKFLALDKCVHGRQFLELIEIPTATDCANNQVQLKYDEQWLRILRSFQHLFPPDNTKRTYPSLSETKRKLDEADEWLKTIDKTRLVIKPLTEWPKDEAGLEQTAEFCDFVGITNPNNNKTEMIKEEVTNPDEIEIDEDF